MAEDQVDGLGMSRPRDSSYGVDVMELRKIMEHHKQEGYDYVQEKYGGVLDLCRHLYTSPNEGNCLNTCTPHPVKVIIETPLQLT